MKKLFSLFLVAGLTAVTFAENGIDDVVVTFSSTGPDKYADGTTVLDGECYALVWTKQGGTFEGLAADGTPYGDSKIVLAAPVAKNGRCPKILFQVSDAYRRKNIGLGGTFNVYLLDTRKITVDPAGEKTVVLQGVDANGKPKLVSAYGAVDGASVSGVVSTKSATESVLAAVQGKVPADTPQPTIKAVKVEGGYVWVTVANAQPCLRYALDSGSDPKVLAADENSSSAYGEAGEDITLVVPKREGNQFYRVSRK